MIEKHAVRELLGAVTLRQKLIIGALTLGLFFIAFILLVPSYSGKNMLSGCAELSGWEKHVCLEDKFLDIAKGKGLEVAFERVFKEFSNGNKDVIEFCHGLTHRLGEKMYQRDSDDSQLFRYGIHGFCAYGYTHGMVIPALQQGVPPEKFVKETCDALKPEGERFQRITCFHGIGHGLIILRRYNIAEALLDCDRLVKYNYEKNDCFGGAFMESAFPFHANLLHNSETHFSPPPPYDRLTYCSKLAERYKESCYSFSVPPTLVNLTGPFLEELTKCATLITSGEKIYCYKGISRYVGFSVDFAPKRALDICLAGPTEAQELCITTALRTRIRRTTDLEGDGIFCGLAPKEYQAACFSKLGESVVYLHSGEKESWPKLCKDVAGNFANFCLREAIKSNEKYYETN